MQRNNPIGSPPGLEATIRRAPAGEGRGGVGGLPDAPGQTFDTLDEYLAFLQQRGTYDIPWYFLHDDGRYELITRRTPSMQAEFFTRDELLARFGFSD